MLGSLFGSWIPWDAAQGALPPSSPTWGDSGTSLRLKAFSGTKIKLSSSQIKSNDKTALLKVHIFILRPQKAQSPELPIPAAT